MDIAKTIRVVPGHYVIAVSGGVDSMVLLDIIRQHPGVKLTVAHFDHGIRDTSHFDRHLVQEVAHAHGLPFVYAEGQLGYDASEEQARIARYEFLRKIQKETGSQGILTAHHMDDNMETAVHNILRGTGRKGMSSLKSVDGIVRPFLHLPKDHLRRYAVANDLHWSEDETNLDMRYRRNYIRHQILPKIQAASPESYDQLKMLLRRQAEINHAIDASVGTILHMQPGVSLLQRQDIIMLPHNVASEVIAQWLRNNGQRQVSRKRIEKLVIAFKTAQPDTGISLDKTSEVQFTKTLGKLVKAA